MGWDRIGRNGMGRDGVGWDGMVRCGVDLSCVGADAERAKKRRAVEHKALRCAAAVHRPHFLLRHPAAKRTIGRCHEQGRVRARADPRLLLQESTPLRALRACSATRVQYQVLCGCYLLREEDRLPLFPVVYGQPHKGPLVPPPRPAPEGSLAAASPTTIYPPTGSGGMRAHYAP